MVQPVGDPGSARDNTAQARAAGNETVLEGQKRALELAIHGAPLRDVLDVIVRTVEAQSANGILSSILLLDAEAKRLRHGAAPSLPAEYNATIDGVAVGPDVGSCGTAAFTGKTVVVSDIESDPLWANFKELALTHGLRACWSSPILSSRGSVLGTFALYHRTKATPTVRDREIVELLGHTAALLIERDHQARQQAASEAALRAAKEEAEAARARAEASERGLQTFIDNLPELAFTARPDGHVDYYNKRWHEYTGTTFEEMQGWGWEKVHDPELLPSVVERWSRSLATGEPFEMEFTLRGKGGASRWFLTRVVPLRDGSGKIIRWFGTSTDINDIKSIQALTAAMAEQSREAQRVLLEMRAEKERAERRVAELEAEKRSRQS
jgi:PAS domain S-box-containing protein